MKKNKTKASKASTIAGFLENMCQEMYAPLNSIAGFTLLLNETRLSKQQSEYVSSINSASRDLNNIITNMLDYSKMELKLIKAEPCVMHLPSVMESVYSMTAENAMDKNLEISLSISPVIPEYIICDPTRITQLLLNLTTNAINFTEKGFVNIRTDLDVYEGTDLVIKYTVQDSGIGIAEENMDTIFECFKHQGSGAPIRKSGSGLGLGIVKHCVNMMGGEIFIKSRLSKGTHFIVTLPAKKCTEEQIAEYKTLQSKAAMNMRIV